MIVAIAKDAAHHTPLASIVLRVGPAVRTIADGPALRGPVVAVGPDGSPVVAWSEYGIGTVAARPDGGGWTRDVVSHAYQDGAPDLGVDADGTAHLAIERDWTKPSVYTDNGILVATSDGGDWTTATGGGGLRRRRRRLRHGRLADLRRGLGRPRARRVGAWRRRRPRQRAGPVARDRARERHVDVGAGAGGVVGRAGAGPRDRPVRRGPPRVRAHGRRPRGRLRRDERRRLLGGDQGRRARRRRRRDRGAGPGRRFRRRRRRVGRPGRRVRRDAERRDVGLAGRGVAGSGGIGRPRAIGRRPAPRVRPAERRAARGRRARSLGRRRPLDHRGGRRRGRRHAAPRGRRRRPPPRRLPPDLARARGPLRDQRGRRLGRPGRDPIVDLGRPGVRRRCGGPPPRRGRADRDGAGPLVRHGRGRRLVDGAGDDDAARRQRRAGGRAGRDRVHRLRGVGRGPVGLARDGHAGRLDADEARGRGRHRHPRHRAGRRTGRSTSRSASTWPARPASPTPRTPAAAGS